MREKILIVSGICIVLILSSIVLVKFSLNNDKDTIVGKINNETQENEGKQNIQSNQKVGSQKEEVYSIAYEDEDYKNLPISYSSATYGYRTDSPEKAMGVADYAFIAKVNGIVKTEYRFPSTVYRDGVPTVIYDPYTVFSVEVIENIKGEITKIKNIEVVQHGGITSDGSRIELLEGMKLLEVGEYYILLPYTAADGRMGISNPTSIVHLGEVTEKEVATFRNIDNIKSSANDLNITTKEDKKIGENPEDIIKIYINAAEKEEIPEGKTVVKSQIYDVELTD